MVRVDEIMPSFNENIIKGPQGIYFPDEEAYALLNLIFYFPFEYDIILRILELRNSSGDLMEILQMRKQF